jgi:hypothetical protein
MASAHQSRFHAPHELPLIRRDVVRKTSHFGPLRHVGMSLIPQRRVNEMETTHPAGGGETQQWQLTLAALCGHTGCAGLLCVPVAVAVLEGLRLTGPCKGCNDALDALGSGRLRAQALREAHSGIPISVAV